MSSGWCHQFLPAVVLTNQNYGAAGPEIDDGKKYPDNPFYPV
jgi:hypothetical protein